jgi:imidazolonepropionase-like amidohydrolase
MLIHDGVIVEMGAQKDSTVQKLLEQIVEEDTTSLVMVYHLEGHLYPGLIAPNTQLGLKEIDRVRASRDYREVGVNNANVRSIIAYNAESKILPTIKYNGILLAEIAPQGFLISGQSSIVELDAWNWEDAAYKTDVGIHISWPSFRYSEKAKKRRTETINRLDVIFQNAEAYAKAEKQEVTNLKYEAMRGLFDHSKKVFVHANSATDIIEAVNFLKRYKVKTVVVGAAQAAKVAGFLNANDVEVVFVRTQSLPSNVDAAYDEKYRTPKVLLDSGVLFCIADQESWQQRNLPFQAGTAVAYGLTKEQALASVTSSTAKIYGLENVGVLAKGKDATLVVSEGDILDMRTNRIKILMIRGKTLDSSNHQEMLYKKYRSKYKAAGDLD